MGTLQIFSRVPCTASAHHLMQLILKSCTGFVKEMLELPITIEETQP
jgi:hypothetical protein